MRNHILTHITPPFIYTLSSFTVLVIPRSVATWGSTFVTMQRTEREIATSLTALAMTLIYSLYSFIFHRPRHPEERSDVGIYLCVVPVLIQYTLGIGNVISTAKDAHVGAGSE